MMKKKQIDKLINVLYGVAAFAVLLGAFFRLQHYPYGNQIFIIGIIAGFVLSGIEVYRLKKIIKGLEKEIPITK